jgi:hypothetical protein
VCFQSGPRRSHWADTKHSKENDNASKTNTRIPIPSTQNIADHKKQFISLLNKLTPDNIEKLCTKYKAQFEEAHASMYIDTIFEYIQRSSELCTTYCKLLMYLHQTFNIVAALNTLASTFLQDRQWSLSSKPVDGENYDEFCDTQKWKRKILAFLQAFMYLMHEKLIPSSWISDFVTAVIQTYKQEQDEYCKEMYLHELWECIQSPLCPLDTIWKFVQSADVDHMKPSALKFRLQDISEAIKKKIDGRKIKQRF